MLNQVGTERSVAMTMNMVMSRILHLPGRKMDLTVIRQDLQKLRKKRQRNLNMKNPKKVEQATLKGVIINPRI
ncbi:unnamed protein product [Anisakis simplex]|uniref:Transposase n=1 Tax=Anisakis simplex TaxID=6269 RepID=A0A0M3JMZ4_ANISI|nr:unnamed protein product [Anisakis simplex]